MLIDHGNLDIYIPKKEQELLDLRQHLVRIKALRIKYTKLRLGWDRWKREYFYSPEINAIADQTEFHYSCGCCIDSSLIVSCYVEKDGMRIYGDPYEICVGAKNGMGSGDVPNSSWEESVREQGFGDIVVNKIKEYFQKNPQEDYLDDDAFDVFKED